MNAVDIWLERSFALTPAERQLAIALFEGESLKSFAQARTISVNTARAQLTSVFVKTGVNRQVNLILMIMEGSRKVARSPPARVTTASASVATHP